MLAPPITVNFYDERAQRAAPSSWHDVTLVMNMMKTRDRFEDSDVRWMPTDDNDPSKRRCDGPWSR